MALETSIIFTNESGRQDAIVIDAVLREEPIDEVETTDHPVEDGAATTDHARKLPTRLRLECLISETPISDAQAARAGIELPPGTLGAALTLGAQLGVPFTGEISILSSIGSQQTVPGYAAAMYSKLLVLQERRGLVTVRTPRRTYTNMMFLYLSPPRDATTGDALVFTAEFKQIRLVMTKEIFLQVTAAALKKSKGLVKTGRQVTKQPTAEELRAARKARLGLRGDENLFTKTMGIAQ